MHRRRNYGAWEPSSPDSFGGGAREDPVGAQKFHGSLDIEMFEKILFSNAQIEISINWCMMERGSRTHDEPSIHRHHLSLFAIDDYGSFLCKS